MRRRTAVVAALAGLVLASVQPTAAFADLAPGTYVFDAPVYSLARSGESLFVGGSFTSQRAATGGGLILSASGSGDPNPASFPPVAGRVRAVTDDGAGGWFIGGRFTHVGGVAREGLAHIKADGTVNASWNPGAVVGNAAASAVKVLTRNGATLYVGGDFSSIGGVARNGVAAINGTSGAVTSWDPSGTSGPSISINDIAVDGSTAFIAGSFTEFGGASRLGFAAANTASGNVLGWNPGSDSAHGRAVSIQGSTAYVAGDFTTIGGETRTAVAALSTATATASAWNAQVNSSTVTDVLATPTAIYVGGNFSSIGGQSRPALAALSPSSGNATSWNANVNGAFDVRLALDGSTLFLVGQFDTVGGQTRRGAAAVDTTTGAVASWNPRADTGPIDAVATAAGKVYVGGGFYGAGPAIGTVRGLARVEADGTLDTDWHPNPTQPAQPWDPSGTASVAALVADGSTLYATGNFTTIGGQSRAGLAALSTSSGSATTWNPNTAMNFGGGGHALALSGTTLYVAGNFTSIGGQTNRAFAALNAATGTATSWNPGAPVGGLPQTYPFMSLAVRGSTVYVGGSFTSIGGQARKGLAATDATTGAIQAWNPSQTLNFYGNFSGPLVPSIVGAGSKLYVSGNFDAMGGQTRAGFAALDAGTALASPWDPAVDVNAPGARVLDVAGDTAYIGGPFTKVGGQTSAGFAAVNATTGAPLPGSPTITGNGLNGEGPARAVQAIGSRLFLGGDLTSVNGRITGPLGSITIESPQPTPGPTNTGLPTVSGSGRLGATLSCSPGSWSGSPSLSYQWLRDGTKIPGASAASYTITAADAGRSLSCRVTATNSGGAASASSAAVAVPDEPDAPPCSCPPPPPPPPCDCPPPPKPPVVTATSSPTIQAPKKLKRAQLKAGFKFKVVGLKPGSSVRAELRLNKTVLVTRTTKASNAGTSTVTLKPPAKKLKQLKKKAKLTLRIVALGSDGKKRTTQKIVSLAG